MLMKTVRSPLTNKIKLKGDVLYMHDKWLVELYDIISSRGICCHINQLTDVA